MATGWLPAESAAKIFGKLGYNIDSLRASAVKRGFKPFEMNADFSVSIKHNIVTGKQIGRAHV